MLLLNGVETIVIGFLYLGGYLTFEALTALMIHYWGHRAILFLREREQEGAITDTQVNLMARSLFRVKAVCLASVLYTLCLVPYAFECDVENADAGANNELCLMYSFGATRLALFPLEWLIALVTYKYFVVVSSGAQEAEEREERHVSRMVSFHHNPLRAHPSKESQAELPQVRNKPSMSKAGVDFTIMDMSSY